MVGGDQTPSLCKNEGGGTAVKRSFLIIARVTSVMPKSSLWISITNMNGYIGPRGQGGRRRHRGIASDSMIDLGM